MLPCKFACFQRIVPLKKRVIHIRFASTVKWNRWFFLRFTCLIWRHICGCTKRSKLSSMLFSRMDRQLSGKKGRTNLRWAKRVNLTLTPSGMLILTVNTFCSSPLLMAKISTKTTTKRILEMVMEKTLLPRINAIVSKQKR